MEEISKRLKNNSKLKCSGGIVTILEYIGAGGQGEVYKVELNGSYYALKLYFAKNCSDKIKINLKKIIKANNVPKEFVMPKYFVETTDRFGYIMNLIPKNFYDINSILCDENIKVEIVTCIKACLNLARAFKDFFAYGYSYKDISLTNVFMNPSTGDVVIIDTDNITLNTEKAGIRGTVQFMAPEIVKKLTKTPTRLTDLYSLAVLFFYLLLWNHPLEGNMHNKSIVDFENKNELDEYIYGSHARFIFSDKNNLEKYILNDQKTTLQLWCLYPNSLKEMFERVFIDGIKDAYSRPNCLEWEKCFSDLLKKRICCSNCGQEIFVDEILYSEHKIVHCPNCGYNIRI